MDLDQVFERLKQIGDLSQRGVGFVRMALDGTNADGSPMSARQEVLSLEEAEEAFNGITQGVLDLKNNMGKPDGEL